MNRKSLKTALIIPWRINLNKELGFICFESYPIDHSERKNKKLIEEIDYIERKNLNDFIDLFVQGKIEDPFTESMKGFYDKFSKKEEILNGLFLKTAMRTDALKNILPELEDIEEIDLLLEPDWKIFPNGFIMFVRNVESLIMNKNLIAKFLLLKKKKDGNSYKSFEVGSVGIREKLL